MLPTKQAVLVIVAIGLKACFANAQCKTTSGDTCQFPFVYNGKVYYGCTKDLDPSSRNLLCSTKTDLSTNEHISSNAGNCEANCPKNDNFTDADNLKAFEINADLIYLRENDEDYDVSRCPCKPYQQCSTLKRLLGLLGEIPKNHVEYSNGITYIKTKICDKRTRKVYCCNYNPSLASTSRPNPKPQQDYTDDKLGTWRPRSDRGDCGSRLEYNNIVGGEDAKLGEFPWMVLLGFQNGDDITYGCGGSVINRWYVLTAAHCIQPGDEPVQLLFGEHELNSSTPIDCNDVGKCNPEPFTRKPAKIIVHEGYEFKKNRGANPNDIALIRLNEPLPFYYDDDVKSAVIPVCLPWNKNDIGRDLNAGVKLTVTGWGRSTNDEYTNRFNLANYNVPTTLLQKLDIPLVSEIECLKVKPYRERLQMDFNLQFCAGGEEGKDSCGGDSGGPVVYRPDINSNFHQVGLVSFGSRICGNRIPGVYTNISSFLDWIDINLEE